MTFKPEYPKIKLSNRDFDFSSWFQEKSDRLLEELSYTASYLNKIKAKEIPPNENINYNEELENHLYAAIGYATGLFNIIYSCEEVHECNKDSGLIMKKGYDGYKELMEKYGMPLLETIQNHEDIEVRNQIQTFICGPRTNRTMIHSLLQKLHRKNDFDQKMADNIEKVTMNELPWEAFIEKYTITNK